jgi:hypothetical protein
VAVALIALAHNQRLVLEPVDEGDDVASVDAEAPGDGNLPPALAAGVGGSRRALTDPTLPIFHRHGRLDSSLRLWWARSFRLLPNQTFQVDEVIVAGGPWATRIPTRVRVHAPLPHGSAYDNVFMQNLYMRWARITDIHTLEDYRHPERTLDHPAEIGVVEARAEPISDTEPAPVARDTH